MKPEFEKRLNRLMILMVSVYVFSCIFKYIDYKTHIDRYLSYSAPWYSGMVVVGIALAVFLILCMALKLLLYRKGKK